MAPEAQMDSQSPSVLAAANELHWDLSSHHYRKNRICSLNPAKLSACFNQINKQKYNFLAKCNKIERSHNMSLIMSRIRSKLFQIKAGNWGSFLRKMIIKTPRCSRRSNEQARISKRLSFQYSGTERENAHHYNERKPQHRNVHCDTE